MPGFEVVSVPAVDQAIHTYGLNLESATDARRLAQIMGVDAVVVGAVTEYTPYYPPRMSLKVEWYAANPNFHPIPAGYGLPWGTPGEKDIPGPLVFQAELALAKEQLNTQTPPYQKIPLKLPSSEAPGSPPAPPPTPIESGHSVNARGAGILHNARTVSHETLEPAQSANSHAIDTAGE